MLRNSVDALKARPQLFRAKLGVYIFIVSLAIFFVAALIAFAIIRTSVAIDLMPLEMPSSFWGSTVVLVAISFLLHLAVVNVRQEKQLQFRRFLTTAVVLAFVFLILQGEGMYRLIATHFSTTDGSGKLYGIGFTLALIHAFHVIGGVVFLIYIGVQMSKDRYDHERHWTVDICATYWHFLDVIWILMLATLWLTESSLRG